MDKKLFAFDLDGTLLNKQSQISPTNIEALKKAKEAGHILVAATGRNYIYTQMAIKDYWNLFDYYIGCNAGIIHNNKSCRYFSSKQKIDYNFAMLINDEMKKANGTIQISTVWGVFIGFYIKDQSSPIIKWHLKEKFFDPYPSIDKMQQKDKGSIVLISVHIDADKVVEYQSKWSSLYGDKYEFAITSKHNIDINPKGIHKLSGIKTIVNNENVLYENVFVFGDTENDLKGIQYYQNTYAMGNALENVKQAAKYVIGTNESNDIAKIILENI